MLGLNRPAQTNCAWILRPFACLHHLQACIELLKPTGGKVHAFITGLPNAGSKALKMRDGNATLAEKEKQMGLLPQDNTYLTMAAQAADFNVGGRVSGVLGLSATEPACQRFRQLP